MDDYAAVLQAAAAAHRLCHHRVYIPCIYVLNKIDQISIEELDIIYKVPHCVPISAHHRWNFDDLLEKIWDYLRLVRM